jgi:hypothetical protein
MERKGQIPRVRKPINRGQVHKQKALLHWLAIGSELQECKNDLDKFLLPDEVDGRKRNSRGMSNRRRRTTSESKEDDRQREQSRTDQSLKG